MNREKEGVPDFVLLTEISEDALMENLLKRYKADIIYTYIGEVVVSVNPYKKLDHLYNSKKIEEYKGRQMYEVPPHIYSLSNDVYRSLLHDKADQCVIISGESGAGKTEASKIFMSYIAAVSKSSTEVDRVKNQLLDSNPILEAFGNAKTLRNDNSSRFGKWMEIEFEYDGAPVGGKITNYLLEKSRVVVRSKGERSFHIFYQIISGLSASEVDRIKLNQDASAYSYLKLSDCIKVDTIDDTEDFKVVSKAMDVLGFSSEDKSTIWQLLSGILHLGNVTFKEVEGKPGVSVLDNSITEIAAALFEVIPSTLEAALISRTITSGAGKRTSNIVIPLDNQQAIFTRDALAKAIYDRLFTWLVEKINKSLVKKVNTKTLLIGVLDIYGFEIFDNNSFEQFCINLCNEKLQQVFIELTLKREQEEYDREGIQWEPVKYFNNKVICELIEGKPMSITALMDECCLIAEHTDKSLLGKVNDQFGTHPHYQSYKTSQDKTIPDLSFRLKHYAGDVTYNVEGFLEKNKDTLFGDLVSCMNGSENALLKEIFPPLVDSKKRPITASMHFKNALSALMDQLMSTSAHYIRCIKPNDDKRANYLDETRIRHQVRYLGLLENIRVRRAGFSYRRPYGHFLWRYSMLTKETWPGGERSAKEDSQIIIQSLQLDKDEYRVGHTKIFIRNPTTLFRLEEEREKTLPNIINLLQTAWRGYWARKQWRSQRAAIQIQTAWRGLWSRQKFEELKASIKIQTQWRGHKDRTQWQRRKATIKIQLFYKANRSARYFKELNKVFADVKTDGTRGKYYKWPSHPAVLTKGVELMKRIHGWWRVKSMTESLSKDQQIAMRQKVDTYDIFHGKKPWDCSRVFKADYLQTSLQSPLREQYINSVTAMCKSGDDSEILFSDEVIKANSNGKTDHRALVVTDRNIYKLDPKKFSKKPYHNHLQHLTHISLSPKEDTWVVVHGTEDYRDLVVDLGTSGVEKYSEFVVNICTQYKKLTGNDLPVKFVDSISYNNARKPDKKKQGFNSTLNFRKASEQESAKMDKLALKSRTLFVKGDKHVNTIAYETRQVGPKKE